MARFPQRPVFTNGDDAIFTKVLPGRGPTDLPHEIFNMALGRRGAPDRRFVEAYKSIPQGVMIKPDELYAMYRDNATFIVPAPQKDAPGEFYPLAVGGVEISTTVPSTKGYGTYTMLHFQYVTAFPRLPDELAAVVRQGQSVDARHAIAFTFSRSKDEPLVKFWRAVGPKDSPTYLSLADCWRLRSGKTIEVNGLEVSLDGIIAKQIEEDGRTYQDARLRTVALTAPSRTTPPRPPAAPLPSASASARRPGRTR